MFYSRIPELFRNCKYVQLSSSSSLPLCFLCRRRRAAPPAAEEGPQATSCCSTATRGTPATSWPHSHPRWSLLPSPRHPCRAPRPPPRRRRGQLGEEPRLPISHALQHQWQPRNPIPSLSHQFRAPKSQNAATGHPNTCELELTVDPPFQTSSAHADPAISSASPSRSSPTAPCRLSTTGAPSPPIPYSEPLLLAVDDLLSAASSSTQTHQKVALGALKLHSSSTLAADDQSRRNRPVNPPLCFDSGQGPLCESSFLSRGPAARVQSFSFCF